MVNSYHLLICSINLVYEHFIASAAAGGAENILLIKLEPNQYLIDYLCKRFDGHGLEVKTVNEHYFKPHVRAMLEDDSESTRLLFALNDPKSLGTLVAKLNGLYEENLKPTGNECKPFARIDQRFFLRDIRVGVKGR